MLQKLTDYISGKQAGWKADFFKEPEQKRHFLLFLAFSVAAICWGVFDYPADPDTADTADTALMLVGVSCGTAGLFSSVAEILPKSQTQLAGILRIWAALVATCAIPAMALQLLLAA